MNTAKVFLLILACFFLSCSHSQPDIKNRKYIYPLGVVYGSIKSINQTHSYSVATMKGDNYTYHLSKDEKILSIEMNGKPYETVYFNSNFSIDSVRDVSWKVPRTIFYYNFPFFETYVHYSIEDGVKVDFIEEEMDSSARTVTFFMDHQISSVSYFNEEGFKTRTELRDTGGENSYTYNEHGYPKEEYYKRKGGEKILVTKFAYEYDEEGNWVKQTIDRYNLLGHTGTITTTRKIEYWK